MQVTTPDFIPQPFAQNGEAASIPANKIEFGRASWNDGFPTETALPLNAGGIPPHKADFNGALKALSQHTFFGQSGCLYPWDATLNYLRNAHVVGSDGDEYAAKLANGPDVSGVGAQDPTLDTDGTYWVNVSDVIGTGSGGGGGSAGYEICEFYNFRHPTARSGMVPRYGSLIQNAATLYPKAWEYLQTTDGQMLCKTEAQWTSMHNASPWSGVGGVPFFVIDTGAGTLRVPDTRGMYAEDAGFDSLGVGGVHGDMIRNITGEFYLGYNLETGTDVDEKLFTSIKDTGPLCQHILTDYSSYKRIRFIFTPENVVPTGNANKPRAYGVLPCVYLGA